MARKTPRIRSTGNPTGNHGSRMPSRTSITSTASDVKNLSNISTTVYDCCCFLFYCSEHQRVMLTRGTIKFFPHAPLNSAKTWFECSFEAALKLLVGNVSSEDCARYIMDMPFQQFILLHLFRFQLPQSQRFITRLTYMVHLKTGSKVIECCKNTAALRWYSLQDVVSSQVSNIWGPEVSFYSTLCAKDDKKIDNPQVEFSLADAFKYIDANGRPEEEKPLIGMLVNLESHDIERLYADFIEHCFPSFFLTRDSFLIYMQRHEIELRPKVIHRYFSAFRIRGKQYMQFTELLLGLAAMDSRTPHAEGRVKYVFRFYDYDKDGLLNFDEFKRLMRDIMPKASDRQVRTEMQRIGLTTVNRQEVVTFEAFKKAVGSHSFRGTSLLCRSQMSPFAQITRSLAARKLCKTVHSDLKLVLRNQRYEGKCTGCRSQQPYQLATNIIMLDVHGRFAKATRLVSNPSLDNYSFEVTFNTQHVCHFLHEQIRAFDKHKGTPKNFKGLFAEVAPSKMQLFYEDVQLICTSVARLVEREDRVLKISDPCYLIGDIHGNLEDLLTLEKTLWPSMPFLTVNYLFLGDFVDRGRWGFECFLYLMLAKLRCPKKCFLLRGNHEVRAIQMKYSFHKELIKKYGTDYGQGIFDLYNYVFDRLPFCAVVNHSVYAAHGGIPCSDINLEHINKTVPRCVQNPELEAITEWEVLWSDPLEYSKFEEHAALLGVQLSINNASYMYLHNTKRGTSYLFNEYAVYRFLNENRLQYVVRAHEVPPDGFKFNFGRLCTTIFSCSHYCGNPNEASVLLIGREQLRIIRVDTTNNASATE